MNTASDPAFEFVKRLGEELARNDFDLPSFPDTALRVREALSNPDVSIETLSNIVLSEPMLTARLLREGPLGERVPWGTRLILLCRGRLPT
jgi:hypothetical protein